MKEIYQRQDNDCMRCALAALLDKEYEEVPHFMEGIKKGRITSKQLDLFNERVDKYLASLNLYRVTVKVKYNKRKQLVLPYFSKDVKVLGTVKKKDIPFSHAIVISISKQNGVRIEFDPLQNSGYNIQDLTEIEFIVKDIEK